VFIPDDLEQGKVVQTAVYDQTLVAVQGTYDDVNRLCSEIAENEEWAFVNVNVRPVLRRGQQDARLRGRRAARLAHPAAGRHPDGVGLAAHEGRQGVRRADEARPRRRVAVEGLRRAGDRLLADRHGLRARLGRRQARQAVDHRAVAGHRQPADGPYALDAVRRTGGAMGHVSDAQVVEGIRLLASTEGLFAETAGGVTVATLKQLLERGQIDPDAETVLYNTGDGLKTLDAVAGEVGPKATITPSYGAFARTGLA
jgi:threonine synthase